MYQAHWRVQKSEGLELPLYVMQEELLFWLMEELDEQVAISAVTEPSHVISPMCQFRNSLYLPILLNLTL